MVEEGIVSGLKNDKIVIRIKRHPACARCRLCAKNEGGLMQIEAPNTIKAQVGDTVLLHLDDNAVLKGALVVYILPLALLLVGLFFGKMLAPFIGLAKRSELASLICGLGSLPLSFFVIKRFDLINREKFRPTVTLYR